MEESPLTHEGLNCQWLRSDSEVVYVALRGHIRRAEEEVLRDLAQALTEREAERFLLDLSGVQYIDSTGLGVLTSLRSQITERGSTLGLVAPSESVLRVLQMSQLDRIFQVIPVDAAGDLPIEQPGPGSSNETIS